MNQKIQILSTRTLSDEQRKLFENSEITLIEKDFIEIETIDFQLKKLPTLLLFTSQNAVYSVLKNEKCEELKNIPSICVGIKTRKKLEENGFKVLYHTNYAKDLAPIILENFANDNISFFSGNLRRDILPLAMQNAQIKFDEYLVYQNKLKTYKIPENVDGMLFFSPSGVESYLKENTISKETCFCIGTTTAEALVETTNNYKIANEQTIESVIKTCIKHFGRKS